MVHIFVNQKNLRLIRILVNNNNNQGQDFIVFSYDSRHLKLITMVMISYNFNKLFEKITI